MNTTRFFAILNQSKLDLFINGLVKIEAQFGMTRTSLVKEKGNTFGMRGDTHTFAYHKLSTRFQKAVNLYWYEFNKEHTETLWRGK